MEFFSKDPAKQLVEIKEKLTERLILSRTSSRLLSSDDPIKPVLDDEIQYLEELLDQIERS